MLRMGIIGCGRIVERGHATALSSLEDLVQVVALCDPSPGRTEAVANALSLQSARRYADYKEMLAKERGLEVVDLALPHFLHEEIAIACARAGLHIISEKPLSTTVESVDRMLSAVKEAGVTLAVLHNYRYDPSIRKGLEIAAAGTVGKVFLVRSEGFGGGHFRGAESYDPDWRIKKTRAGGGCLIDNAYHDIYLAREFVGSPVTSVYARVGTFVQPIDVDDTALMLLAHLNGGTSSVQKGWSIKGGATSVFEVHGDAGSIYFRRDKKPLSVYLNKSNEWDYPEPVSKDKNSFVGIFRDTLVAMAEGGTPPTDALEARRNIEVIEAAYKSARIGAVVRIA